MRGYVAVVLRDELEALDAELARALGAAHRDLPGEVDEARVAPDELLEDVVLRLAERVGQLARGLAGAVDQVGRGGDRHRGVRDRELVAVDVGDRAAPGGDDDVVLLLRDRGGLERVGAHEAEPARAARREQQHDEEDGEEEPDPALDQHYWTGTAASVAGAPRRPSGRRRGVAGRGAGRARRRRSRRGRRGRSVVSGRRRDRRGRRARLGAASRARCRRWRAAPRRPRSAATCASTARAASPGRGVQVADVAGRRHEHARAPRRRSGRGRCPRAARSRPRARRSGARASRVVSTARPMPEFSLSSETCMATTPSSAAPSSQIHRRPRSARSSQRLSGSARTRANARLAADGRGAAGHGDGAADDRARDAARRARRDRPVDGAAVGVAGGAGGGVIRAPPRR